MSLHRNLTETTSPNEGERSLWGACVIGSAAPQAKEGLWENTRFTLMPRGEWFPSKSPSELLNSFWKERSDSTKGVRPIQAVGGIST